jgi:putative intracellular protease/amidase
MKSLNSLIIATSNDKRFDTNRTGVTFETLADPYYILKDGGEYITIVSPQGGRVPLGNMQSDVFRFENTTRFQQDSQAMYHLSHSLPLNEVTAENFDLVFVTGGYGSMWDFVNNQKLKQLLEDFNQQKKPIGLVGHGVVALVSLTQDDGHPLVKGRKVTGFSNSEEASVQVNEHLPFLLELKLISLGALYTKGPDFTSYVVTDGNIITGQNPASSAETAKQLLSLARNKRPAFRNHFSK